jgi:hypothetical protein
MKNFDETEKHLLSSFLDKELEQEAALEAENLIQSDFQHQVQYRNFTTVQKACAEMAEASQPFQDNDFLGGIFAQIENLEPDNPADDAECLSAWVDSEMMLTEEELADSALALPYQRQYHHLSAALQALPVPELALDFAEQVMERIDATQDSKAFAPITEALQALSVPTPSIDFMDNLMERIDTEASEAFAPIAEALQALPVPELSADFAAQVMNRLDSVDSDSFAPIAEALQALPVPEISTDFVARVMLATESLNAPQKAKLFALPTLWQNKWGQMVAAVAVFGLLLLVSQNLLQTSSTVAQNIPSDRIVQVEYAPEAEFFDDVMNTPLENTPGDDYNLLIGG